MALATRRTAGAKNGYVSPDGKLRQPFSSFLTHVRVEKGLSSKPYPRYRRDLVKFDEFARKRKLSLEAVSRDDLVDFPRGALSSELESKTVAPSPGHAAQLFPFCSDPGPDFRKTPVNLDSPKIRRSVAGLSPPRGSRAPALPARCENSNWLAERAMLEVLYSTGLGVSELTGLRVTDLRCQGGLCRCIGKGDKERIVPAGKKAARRRRKVSAATPRRSCSAKSPAVRRCS